MSLDRSLKVSGGLASKRSVMTRAERVAALADAKRIDKSKDPALGLPKTKPVVK